MPRFLEKKLKAEAAKKGFKGREAAAYVYGTMNNLGAMHGSQETAKGAEMQKKHEADAHLKRQHEDMKKFKGVSTTYDHKRPKRQIVTRYTR